MNLRDAILAIRDDAGDLTPAIVLAAATANKTQAERLLHSRLEWNDQEAADAWRLAQCRSLLRSVRLEYVEEEDGPKKSIRAFHCVPREDGGRHYVETAEVAEDEDMRQLLLRQMERDWRSFKARWEHMDEFADLVQADELKLV